jgi:hypothetical protein
MLTPTGRSSSGPGATGDAEVVLVVLVTLVVLVKKVLLVSRLVLNSARSRGSFFGGLF